MITACQEHKNSIVIHDVTEACPLCRMQDELDNLNRRVRDEEENVNER